MLIYCFFVGIICFDAFPCHCCEITVFPPAEGLKARTTLAYHSLSAAVSGRCGLLWSDLMLCRLVGYDDLGAGAASAVNVESHGPQSRGGNPVGTAQGRWNFGKARQQLFDTRTIHAVVKSFKSMFKLLIGISRLRIQLFSGGKAYGYSTPHA